METTSAIQGIDAPVLPLRAALLAGAGDAAAMRAALGRVMEQARAELCAYYTAAECGVLHVLAETPELAPLVPGIGEKLATSFRMFANRPADPHTCREHVHYSRGVAEAGPGSDERQIESYFIVPVASGPAVSGVLLVGSVRRDAFVRETILSLRDLALAQNTASAGLRSGESPGGPGEMLASLPYAAALVDAEGNFAAMNPLMEGLLAPRGGGEGADPGSAGGSGTAGGSATTGEPGTVGGAGTDGGPGRTAVPGIEGLRGFDLHGLWEEFALYGRSIVDRRVNAEGDPRRSISASIVRMERLAGEARSLLVVRDISEAAGREREREEMLAVVAHEIRTPMTALRNALRIMLESAHGGSGADAPAAAQNSASAHDFAGVRADNGTCPEAGDLAGPGSNTSPLRFIETALRTVDRLTVLVDGLVESSSVRPHARAPHLERVEMLRFISDAAILFENSIRKKEIAFDIDVDQSATLAYLDRAMIERVIQNLLSNSLRHVPAGGWVRLTAQRCAGSPAWIDSLVPAAPASAADFIVLRVVDSGPGIPAEVAERINAQSGAGPDAIRPAGGLGLSIAARLVRFHGGRIMIDGHGPGSSVELYLPADAATSGTMRAALAAQSVLHALVASGSSPVLYALTKNDPAACWLEIAGVMNEQPLFNPVSEEAAGAGVCFWPLGERIALAVTAARRYHDDPPALFGRGGHGLRLVAAGASERLELGWAAHPRDGLDYGSLLKAATERMLNGAAGPLRKGALE